MSPNLKNIFREYLKTPRQLKGDNVDFSALLDCLDKEEKKVISKMSRLSNLELEEAKGFVRSVSSEILKRGDIQDRKTLIIEPEVTLKVWFKFLNEFGCVDNLYFNIDAKTKRITFNLDKCHKMWQWTSRLLDNKKPLRIRKTDSEKIYRLEFNSEGLYINEVLLKKPHHGRSSYHFLVFILQRSGRNIPKEEIIAYLKQHKVYKKQTIDDILSSLGFKGLLRKIFFKLDGSTVRFDNDVDSNGLKEHLKIGSRRILPKAYKSTSLYSAKI